MPRAFFVGCCPPATTALAPPPGDDLCGCGYSAGSVATIALHMPDGGTGVPFDRTVNAAPIAFTDTFVKWAATTGDGYTLSVVIHCVSGTPHFKAGLEGGGDQLIGVEFDGTCAGGIGIDVSGNTFTVTIAP